MMKIALTKGKFAIVDNEDFEWLSQNRWCFDGRYATGKHGRMHRAIMKAEIMEAGGWKQVDHINGDKLDNRKENLRLCSNAQNQMNSTRVNKSKSGYKGVYKKGSRWQARIFVDGKKLYLGSFNKITDAVTMYDSSAKKYFGEFAKCNSG